ncbi:MAG: maltose alpha-D-glucosyltransferase, partial [Planctomycetota bacterium]
AKGAVRSSKGSVALAKDPLWYRRAVVYELHVRAFADSDGDGVGDFRGLTGKLDYLRDLGVTTLWLLPFYPSPLKDDGYDIADYVSIHPAYGTLADFRVFLREAHRRGLRVITELVLNHTSDQHPWFQRSRRARPGTRWREYYVWSETPEKYRDARIIFKDFESSNWTWDPVAKAYYWHRFYSHQPDLNYENPEVHEEIFRVLDFWLGMGVDGLRLDAVPYLYEREGTNCENLPETHAFLKKLRAYVEERYEDRVLIAEANQWPEDAAAYFGSGEGDECHMAFHFPLMPRLFMGIRQEDRIPIVDILEETPPIPPSCQWAVFLRNHDELTLEMVTDEERDYMYRVYAADQRARLNLGIRRRLAPLLGDDRKRIQLMVALLLSLPGTPFLYYGDEIGMGDNIFLGDRNAVRTPMQWSADRNAGFSRANPQSLYLPVVVDPEYHYESVNVETQERNPHSLLWWTRRILGLRKRWKAFGEGAVEFLSPKNRKILAFVRTCGEERVLVVANLSRFVQPASIDLSRFAGLVPVELFGRARFPRIGAEPYFLTLGPHSFYWFSIEPVRPAGEPGAVELPMLEMPESWDELFETESAVGRLEKPLVSFLRRQRWYGRKSREIKSLELRMCAPVRLSAGTVYWCLVRVDDTEGESASYQLPLAFLKGEEPEGVLGDRARFAIARARLGPLREEGTIADALGLREFSEFLIRAIERGRRLRARRGAIAASALPNLRRSLAQAGAAQLEIRLGSGEETNSTVVYGNAWILKVFRKVEAGVNPDLEILKFLTKKRFAGAPPLGGSIEKEDGAGERATLGVLTGFIPGCKDGWVYTIDVLGRFYERVQSLPWESRIPPSADGTLAELVRAEVPPEAGTMLGVYAEAARLLGWRTAEFHSVLASETRDKDFAPEPFTPHYQKSLFQGMRASAVRNLRLLKDSASSLPQDFRPTAERAAGLEGACVARLRAIFERKIRAQRIRIHGDYHLGQVLHTGRDFQIIDFEGEPARPLAERRIKRSPLQDVAGMLRSFDYAAHWSLREEEKKGGIPAAKVRELEAWARYWRRWAGVIFLQAYLERARRKDFLPPSEEDLWALLEAHVLEKTVYEIGYELDNRPEWVSIPTRGLLDLLVPSGEPRER